jgi:hypothetical protein
MSNEMPFLGIATKQEIIEYFFLYSSEDTVYLRFKESDLLLQVLNHRVGMKRLIRIIEEYEKNEKTN